MIILALLLAIAIALAFWGCASPVLIYAGIAAGIIFSVMLYKIYEKQCDIKQELDFLVFEKNKENSLKEEQNKNNDENNTNQQNDE